MTNVMYIPSDIMDGSDATMLDSKVLQNHLDNRGEAVGRTRGVGDQASLLRELFMVASQHDVQGSFLLDRSTDNDLLGTAFVKVGLKLGNAVEFAGALHHQLDAHIFVASLGEVSLGAERHHLTIDREGLAILGNLDLALPGAVHRIVLEQVSSGFATAQIIHVNDFEVGILPGVTEADATDAAEAVDCALDGHAVVVGGSRRGRRRPEGNLLGSVGAGWWHSPTKSHPEDSWREIFRAR